MKELSALLPLSVALGFTMSSLPARSIPPLAVELVRISGNGVQAMPQTAFPSIANTNATDGLATLPTAPSGDETALLPPGSEEFSITFQDALPDNLNGYLSIRRKISSGDARQNGKEIKQISFDSPDITFSEGRKKITFRHGLRLLPGETICALFPLGPYTLPQRLTPCCFTIIEPPLAVPAATYRFPWWIVPVGIGIGVGICAAAGCFGSDGDGGTSRSSQ